MAIVPVEARRIGIGAEEHLDLLRTGVLQSTQMRSKFSCKSGIYFPRPGTTFGVEVNVTLHAAGVQEPAEALPLPNWTWPKSPPPSTLMQVPTIENELGDPTDTEIVKFAGLIRN
ncbi:hypothetical protein [Bradyrhizobium macuxiense]|nr:hypothetical protein [Bradyrhizobium macuxiense]